MTEQALKEIFHKHVSFSKNDDIDQSLEDILSAMREANRLDSIGFGDFLNKNNYYKSNSPYKWHQSIFDTKTFTIDQLYNEYQKTK